MSCMTEESILAKMAYEESESSTSINHVFTPNSITVNQGSIPKLIRTLIDQGRTSADAQIKELLTDIQYPENLYALKYILEHQGHSVSLEMLVTAMAGLRPQTDDMAFSEEAPIKLEWQLRIVTTILEQLCERRPTLTSQFLDNVRKTTSTYKRTHEKISQLGRNFWKSNCSEFNDPDGDTKSFKCNYDNKYLFKVIENTLNSICGDRNYQQTSVDRAIAVLKALLLSTPALVKMGLKMTTGVEVPLGDFELERAWMYLVEAFQIESSGEPWYTTLRRLIKLKKTLDEWSQEKDCGISTAFKERLFLELLWFHISLCYSDNAAKNQQVSDVLWFGILDLVQQLIWKTSSITTQAICYYLALDSLNNAVSEFIQFKSIEVLLNLEAKNKELFVTTPDDIAGCEEKHIPKLVEIYHYLKDKLEVESKLHLKYSPDNRETREQDSDRKGKGKEKYNDKSPIEDFKCPITCETVDGLYQLNCQHSVSFKVLSSFTLEKQECPYCRTEIKKDGVYYLPQQTIYNNIQCYIAKDDQDVYDSTDENNPVTELFDQHDNPKKQKKENRRYDNKFTLNTIWKTIRTPTVVNKLLQKAKTACKNNDLEGALNTYSQILQEYPTNYTALYNRAFIKLKMGHFEKALFDIETVIEVNDVYDNIWYLSLLAHVALENKKGVEQDIGHIKCLDIQWKAFDVINEYANKLEFDVEWFKILVDSSSHYAMDKLDNINQWKSLCNHLYGTDDYSRWYNTAASWYKEHNNTGYNYKNTNAFFEKVYYMHKSHLKAHFTYESHVDDINECRNYQICLRLYANNKVTIPIFKVPPNEYKLSILLNNYWDKSITFVVTIKTSTEEIQHKTGIKRYIYRTEYILPCAVNVLSEDDIIIDIFTHSSVNLFWVCLYSEEKFQTMQNNFKVEKTSTGVKIIDYNHHTYQKGYLLN